MKPKRIISLLLAICLVAGLMPTVAFATGSDKAIMRGTEHLQGAQADNIYFGNWTAPDKYTTSGPIKWRVLDTKTNMANATEGDGLFLLSDVLLGTSTDGGVYFQQNTHLANGTYYKGSSHTGEHTSCQIANAWQDSDAQAWCSTFYRDNLTTQEQGAVLATTKSDEVSTSSTNQVPFAASSDILNGDKVFFLSAEEAETSSYGFESADDRKANYNGSAGFWWLRSPDAHNTRYAGLVTRYEDVNIGSAGTPWAARPAFNLNLNSVLFTSAAVGGKAANGMDSGLTAVGSYDGSEWKLTLLDSTRNSFAISNATINGDGDTIAFSYSGAQTGTNEYISVVIETNNEITHYGRILQLDGTTNGESGTASLTLPAGVRLGDTTKLYVFNEQYNGGENDDTKRTDYGSALIEVNPTVDETAPTLKAGEVSRISDTSATVKFTSNEAGSYYYEVVNSGENQPTIDTAGTGTSCASGENTIFLTSLSDAGAKDIYIVAKDAVGNVSSSLKIEIQTYIAPVYAISADTESWDFGTVTEGYTEAPAAKKVTITNTGNQTVTVDLPTSTNYIITAGDGFTNNTATLALNGTAAFTAQPNTGLGAGDYSETLTISGSGNASVQVALSFTVNTGGTSGGDTGGSTTDYYRLTFDTNGGSEIASILRAEYTTVDLSGYTPTREGYEFTGWYADEDLTDKITSIRLTRNTTIYAGWKEIKDNPGTGFENPFTDVSENDWFYDDVMFVFANDLMVGTGDATFSPEISTSRAMIAVTLWRMEGEPSAKGANPFTDVENGAWYTEAITWANENGIAEGYGNGCFQPETPVTREQLAAFFYRYAAYKGYDITITGSLDHFNDKDNVSEWAKDTMAWAVGYGLIGGKDNNMLDPQGEATRAEFAAMLQRFCQKG